MRKSSIATLLALMLAATDTPAQDASNHPLLSDDWLFRLGGSQTDADVKVGLGNAELGDIPIFDLGSTGSDTRFGGIWGQMIWQAPDRWSWGLTYFRSEVDGERLSDKDYAFGDLEIPAGTGVQSDFVTNFYILNGYYDFYQKADRAAGVGFGVYALEMDVQLQAVLADQSGPTSESADTLAPLPTLSLYYKHAFNEKWALWADVGYFSANIDKYDGDILAGRLSVDYWFNENWGLGLGYNYVDLELTVDEAIFDQRYEAQWDSFFLYLTGGF